MSTKQNIPQALIGYNVYFDDVLELGIADVELPNITMMTTDTTGSGIAGKIKSPILAQTEELPVKITFTSKTPATFRLAEPKAVMVTFREAHQSLDRTTGNFTVSAVKVTAKILPISLGLGKLENGTAQSLEGETEAIYLKVEIGSTVALEIDKLNYKYVVNGTDYGKEVRQALGEGTGGISNWYQQHTQG